MKSGPFSKTNLTRRIKDQYYRINKLKETIEIQRKEIEEKETLIKSLQWDIKEMQDNRND